MVGNYPSMREGTYSYGVTFSQGGDNNLLKGLRITSRGSHSYGYGHALMYDGIIKRDAFDAMGQKMFISLSKSTSELLAML